ncbi:tripartite tricarboxylate transporter substrate binding protein [Roseomonas sp. AR75]|uniref:Bug family tripartite tricarboxylate transporter substrate binding protein n=1 Tax=Roseomonas sp. AR75 TaxID=2562311 RepID=UPI0010C0A468|nr:tripartite tricarboxylate transporter substrate binding protein [Roseomonas sp. AR75]
MPPSRIARPGRRAVLSLGALLAAPSVARAQAWPSRPVRFVVPYGAGNQADQVARVLADALAARWGQRLVVENLPGAGGAIGVAQIARAAPDGYTIGLIAIAALAITPHIQAAPYDPLTDLAPLGAVTVSRSALVVHPSLPVNTLAELVALARQRSGDPLFFSSPGIGTIPHLNMEMLARALAFPAHHVPYRTAGAATADLVAGRVQMALDGITVTLPHIEAGRLRALFATGAERLPQLPEVPALAEASPGLDLPSAWQSVHGPRGLPEEIAARIAADVAALVADPDFARRLPQGSDALVLSREETAARIRSDNARFGALVRELGLRAG